MHHGVRDRMRKGLHRCMQHDVYDGVRVGLLEHVFRFR
jgi:hypothetical protein